MPRAEASGPSEVPWAEPSIERRTLGRNEGREVAELRREGRPAFYEKRYLGRGATRRRRREASVHRRLAALGLPVAEVRCEEDARLVLGALEGRALDRAFGRCRGTSAQRLCEEVGRLVARLHAAGWAHGQLHAWHVQVDEQGRAALMDLAEVRRASPARRRRDWAALFATLDHRTVSRSARLRMLRAAGLSRSDRRRTWAALPRRLETARRRFRFPRTWQGREWIEQGDRLLVHRSVLDGWGPLDRSRWHFAFEPPGVTVVRERDGRRNLRWTDERGAEWFGKAFARRGRSPRHPAMEEFAAHRTLEWLGIEVPTVLAVGRAAAGPSVLWTRGVVPGESVRDRLARGGVDPILVREWLDEIARWTRRLHGAGLVHSDLYLDHFLLRDDPPGLVCIDLGRLRTARGRRARRKDLAALELSARSVGVSRTQRLRMFRWYLGGWSAGLRRGAGSRRRVALLRAVVRRADRIEGRERRHGRWPSPSDPEASR